MLRLSLLVIGLLLVGSARTLPIVLLAYDRPEITMQCLKSIAKMRDDQSFNVSLKVRIDRLHDGSVNERLIRHRRILKLAIWEEEFLHSADARWIATTINGYR